MINVFPILMLWKDFEERSSVEGKKRILGRKENNSLKQRRESLERNKGIPEKKEDNAWKER